MTIMAVFLSMVVITVFLVFFYGERKAQDFVRFCLEDLNRTVLNRMDYNLKYNAVTEAEMFDEWIRSAPEDYAVFKEISLTAQVKNVKAGRTGCFCL